MKRDKYMKKIFFYIDTMERGGAQRVMLNLINHYIDMDVMVVLCNDFVKDDAEEYAIPKEVKRVYLAQSNSGNVLIKNVKRIILLRSLIINEKPDIVLSFLGRPNIRVLLATIGLHVKKIVSVRNDPNQEYGDSIAQKIFVNSIFRLADGCVFQTQEAKKYFAKVIQKKSAVIFNPVGDSFFKARMTADPHNIVSVGRFEFQKNHRLLMLAFKRIADRYPEENLIIYGTGSLYQEYLDLRKKLRLEKRILFPGNILNVPEALAQAKVFVLPSDYEGLPNALMEAMAVGLPCIATNCPCGGPNELMENGEEGLLIPVGDLDALCAALEKVLSHPLERRRMGKAAKRRAEEFRQEYVLGQWDNYFELVLKEFT